MQLKPISSQVPGTLNAEFYFSILFFLMRTAFGGSLLTLGSFLADFGSSQLILGDRSISLGVAHVDVGSFCTDFGSF